MKDHPDRKRRLQLIEAMFAGHSWQEALAQCQRLRNFGSSWFLVKRWDKSLA